MYQIRKITRIFFLIFFAVFLASCSDDLGCVEADEFDVESLTVSSNPVDDGITGTYPSETASWHETGLKSNGDKFLIQVSGGWTAWNGSDMNDSSLYALPRCDFCAMKTSPLTPNCICYQYTDDGSTYYYKEKNDNVRSVPKSENGDDGLSLGANCTTTTNQNDPDSCSCTQDATYGSALDYGTYHFALDLLNKDESTKASGDSENQCRYDRGMGLYIGLFGSTGVDTPVRLYHLFSPYEICNVTRNSDGDCLDDNGNDATRYVFTSANSRIFMKDDHNGNDGTDTNTADDDYHGPNEYVKFKIYESYYSDNYGSYNISILRGVGNSDSYNTGLLEFLVSLFEDSLLGTIDSSGERQGGVIEFTYQSIVQDSNFITALQVALSLYIAIFGAAHMFGVAEIMNKKELMGRILKIGLIIFFTSSSSWYFYNKIIVGLFKDSMDYVVAMMMSLSDANLDPTSMTVIAQMDRASDLSNATRFSYIDLMIKKLFSRGVSKKVFGLLFGTNLGLVYIPAIYALIGYFLYVVLVAAMIYTVNLIKLILVLAMGPVFICFTLFSHTSQMFKNWLGFLGGRSLEVVLLFSVLYNFLILIDQRFTDLLYFRACVEPISNKWFPMHILKSYISSRSLMDWLMSLVNIGGLIFIMQLVMDKVANLAGSLVTIDGVANKDVTSDNDTHKPGYYGFGKSGFALAGSMMGQIRASALNIASTAVSGRYGATWAGSHLIAGLDKVARASGISEWYGKATENIPFNSPRTWARHNEINNAIAAGRKQAAAAGLKGKAAEEKAQQSAYKALFGKMNDPKTANKMRALGVNEKNIEAQFKKKFEEEPLKKIAKEEAKKMKKQGDKTPVGEAAREELRNRVMERAEKDLAGGKATAKSYLGKEARDRMAEFGPDNRSQRKINKLIEKQSQMGVTRAAEQLANDPKKLEEYRQKLQEDVFKRAERNPGRISRAAGALNRRRESNPEKAQRDFEYKLKKQQELNKAKENSDALFFKGGVTKIGQEINPANRLGLLRYDQESKDKARKYRKDFANKRLAGEVNQSKPADKTQRESEKAKKKNAEEAKRDKFEQEKLAKKATKNVRKEAEKLARQDSKQPWVNPAKNNLLQRARDGLEITFDATSGVAKIKARDEDTVFERIKKIDGVRGKFGYTGKSIENQVLAGMSKEREEFRQEVEKSLAAATNSADIKKIKEEAKKLDALKPTLFQKEIELKMTQAEFDALQADLAKKSNDPDFGRKTPPGWIKSHIPFTNNWDLDSAHKEAEKEAAKKSAKELRDERVKIKETEEFLDKAITERGEEIARQEAKIAKEAAELKAKEDQEAAEKEARKQGAQEITKLVDEINAMPEGEEKEKAKEDVAIQILNFCAETSPEEIKTAEELGKTLDEKNAIIDAQIASINAMVAGSTEQNAAIAELAKEAEGFPTEFKVTGLEAANVLLEAPKILPEGDIKNLLLGIPDSQKKEGKNGLLNALRTSQLGKQNSHKVKAMQLRIKEFELSKETDQTVIAALHKEIADLQTEVRNIEQDAAQIENQITNLNMT